MKKFKKIEYLILGISFLGMGFYFFGSQVFTTENSLFETKGIVENSKVYYEKVKDKYGIETTRATLNILLLNNSKIFRIRKNIGKCSENNHTSENRDEIEQIIYKGDTILKFNSKGSSCFCYQYERMSKKIIPGEKLSIFIKKNDLSEFKPYVYGIITHNNEKIYDLDEAKENPKFGFWVSNILGFSCFFSFLTANYLEKIKI